MSGAPTVQSLPPTAPPPTASTVGGLGASPPEATAEAGTPETTPLFAELLRSQISGRFPVKAEVPPPEAGAGESALETAPLFAELLRSQISGYFSVKTEAPPTPETAPTTDVGKTEQAGVPTSADALAAIMPLLLAQTVQNTPLATPSIVAVPRTENAVGRTPQSAPLLAAVTERSATATDSPALPASAQKAATISLAPANVATETPPYTLPESRTQGSDTNAFQAALASAQGLAAAPVAHGGAHRMPELPIAAPLGAPGWDRQVGDKLTWMVNRQESSAALVLTPPQLGRIEVSISLNGDQANAVFVSQNPAVREALEAALPRLRETLADAGISLGQAQVGSDAPPPRGEERRDNSAPRTLAANDSGDGRVAVAAPAAVSSWIASGRGMVDTFA